MKNFRVIVNGTEYKVAIEELEDDGQQLSTPSQVRPEAKQEKNSVAKTSTSVKPSPATPPGQTQAADGSVLAPMPGTIIKVCVEKNASVSKGQTLVILEAMKMENEIMSPVDGVVKSLNVAEGTSVNAGESLVEIG